MDRGIWAIRYEMPEDSRSEYLDWLHRAHIPEKLSRQERFVPHEELAHDTKSWTSRVLPRLVHAPCSPAVGRRIWPPVRDGS